MDENQTQTEPVVTMEDLLEPPATPLAMDDAQLQAVIEAIIYVTEEPLMVEQLAAALDQPAPRVEAALERLMAEFEKPEHGITVRQVAGGFKLATKVEHHDSVRDFAKSLKPPLKLSPAALETLALIAYKQPVTGPEIMEVRGVQGAGVLKTLLDRKLITTAGRKNVVGKPMQYKTTREFMLQFGLKDLSELPSLKEFEEMRRLAVSDGPLPDETPASDPAAAVESVPAAPEPESSESES
jgi:segregation and condensation protein B